VVVAAVVTRAITAVVATVISTAVSIAVVAINRSRRTVIAIAGTAIGRATGKAGSATDDGRDNGELFDAK
jgi:hypothetical protein